MTPFSKIVCVSLLALAVAMPAFAQQPDAGPQTATAAVEDQDGARGGRDVVIITANKREESVQDIAVAVTAITDELRDQIGLTTVQDYTNFAPGLTYSTSTDRLGMRGVTRTSNNFGIRSGISNYIDGVYYSSAIPASREPIFVDRVEVVRGPQGTLYGRDSIGGALNLISKRPTEDFEGQFNLSAGNYDSLSVQATASGPITDWARYRLGYSRASQNDGYLTNYSGLRSEGGGRNDTYYEAALEFDIGDDIDVYMRANSLTWDVRYGAPGARVSGNSNAPYDTRIFTPDAFGSLFASGLFGFSGQATDVDMLGSQTTNPGVFDSRGFNTDFSDFAHLEPTKEYALEVVWHAPAFDVKYLGGYNWYHYNLQQDNDGSPVKGYTYNGKRYETEMQSDYNENRGWFSNEINLVSTQEGPLQWIAGAYQYQENYSQPIYISGINSVGGDIYTLDEVTNWLTFAGPFTGAPISSAPDLPDFTGRNSSSGSPFGGDLLGHTNNQGLNNAYGLFLQADYQLNDQLKFTAGLRWSKDIMNGREYARLISRYGVEEQLEAGFAAAYTFLPDYAGLRSLLGPDPAAVIAAVVPAVVPARIDVTSTLGGPDPSTISTLHPCGLAAKGVVNLAPENTANCNDKTQFGIYTDAATGNVYRDLHASWEEVTGVLGVDWTPDDDTLIYAKYNRGYKPGGLGCSDPFCFMVVTPYTDKELVDAYELGYKKDWRDLNLTTNATLFFYDYKGYQIANTIEPSDPDGTGPIPRPNAYAPYFNLPQTLTTGFELETIWYPTDNLRFIFNYGYTNPEIQDTAALGPLINSLDPFGFDPHANPLGAPVFSDDQLAAGCDTAAPGTPNCSPTVGQNLKGNILPFSPKNKVALNGVYTWNLEDGAKVDASLSYFWQDVSYTSVFNMKATEVPSWDQTDGRISWTSADGNITLIGWIKNMFDEIQYDSAGYGLREGDVRNIVPTQCGSSGANSVSHLGNPSGSLGQDCLAYGATYRPPRTFGADLQIRF